MMLLKRNKGCNSLIEISDICDSTSVEEGMLTYNRCSFFPEAQFRCVDNVKSLIYRVDGMSALSVRFGRVSPGKNEMRSLMRDIRGCLLEMDDYMLEPDNLVISLSTVFYSPEDDRCRFIYAPGSEKGFSVQLKALLEEMMQIYDHRDRESVMLLYDIYSRFLVDNFSPQLFMKVVDELEDVKLLPAPEEEKSYEKPVVSVPEPYIPEPEKEKADKKPVVLGILAAAFAETAIFKLLGLKGFIFSFLILIGLTVWLSGMYLEQKKEKQLENDMQTYAPTSTKAAVSFWDDSTQSGVSSQIEQAAGGENIENYPMLAVKGIAGGEYIPNQGEYAVPEQGWELTSLVPFDIQNIAPIVIGEGDREIKIGRIQDSCDYCLIEPGISRLHAVIIKSEGVTVIWDKASTNGTYINNKRLQPDSCQILRYGDVVSFAGVEFYCM